MGSHPINLALRFLLEIAALVSLGIWGWQKGDGWLRIVMAVGIPLIFAVLWGTFRVPNDPGAAPVAVAGALRLALELVYFSLAAWMLYDIRLVTPSLIFGTVVTFHYLISYDRILWLLKQ